MNTSQLVEQLGSSSGWLRDAAQRLLVTSTDKAAIEPLKKLVVTSPASRTRMQALCTLDGLAALTPELILSGIGRSTSGSTASRRATGLFSPGGRHREAGRTRR